MKFVLLFFVVKKLMTKPAEGGYSLFIGLSARSLSTDIFITSRLWQEKINRLQYTLISIMHVISQVLLSRRTSYFSRGKNLLIRDSPIYLANDIFCGVCASGYTIPEFLPVHQHDQSRA
jgi:hypothetical protein